MRKKIIAVVPNYNGGEMLLNILAQLKEHPFDDIYVLDDFSTDNSAKRVKKEYPDVKLIKGSKNLGSGGNRNRIIAKLTKETDLVFFVDADMKLLSGDIVEVVRKKFRENKKVGMLGGLIFNKKMEPMGSNYGHEMHPIKDALLLTLRGMIGQESTSKILYLSVIKKLKKLGMDYHWVAPNEFALKERVVDWVAEGFCIIRASLFKDLGGYDKNMHYHEIHDLTHRMRSKNYEVLFTPDIRAQHLELKVRSKRRRKIDSFKAQSYFLNKRWSMNKKESKRFYER